MLFMCGFWGFSFLYVMVAASMVLCDGLRKEEYQNIKGYFFFFITFLNNYFNNFYPSHLISNLFLIIYQ